MTLDGYLTAHNITNAEFAAALRRRRRKLRVSPGWISQIRNGVACGRKLALLIEEESAGKVRAVEVLRLEMASAGAAA